MILHCNQSQQTALFYAADQGNVEIAELLMEHGVELELKNEVLSDIIASALLTSYHGWLWSSTVNATS